CSSYVGSNVLF
nr:immunoglobulin light chain junction region [Macaca mulatta]MPO06683.1 immunoglobulin light chain junction region [Macaca mulatta]MPO07441.1 immunoglobulin light chain junction region [Macaca mulatta]MPO08534.1 immunoglobulin light chain junction region [Macaca mulatta]MPO08712.1 immunoglobulin light chain junction region [Macaca mulatta]